MFWNPFFASLGLPDSDSGAKDDRWTDGRTGVVEERDVETDVSFAFLFYSCK